MGCRGVCKLGTKFLTIIIVDLQSLQYHFPIINVLHYTQLMAAQSAMYQATATEAANISDLLILARDVTATGAANPVLFEPDTTGVAMRRAVF